jgi:hypothetical protein
MAKFTVRNPFTRAGEGSRALQARMWNNDLRFGVGGYVISAEHVTKIFAILSEDAESALRDAGFQPMLGGFWQTRFRNPNRTLEYVTLTPPFALLRMIARHFPSSAENKQAV